MIRRGVPVLAVLWAALLAASLVRIGSGLARSSVPPEDRAAFETGDPGYHGFLARVRSAAEGAGRAVLLLVEDPAREDEFVSYRAAYELYPVPVRVSFRSLPKAGGQVSLAADTETWAVAHNPGILGMVARRRPDAGRIRRITADRRGKLSTAPLAERPPPARSLPGRPGPWLAGIFLLLAAGWLFILRAGLAPARSAAALALGWVAGTGLFGWLLTVLSLCGVPWTRTATCGVLALGTTVLAAACVSRRLPHPPAPRVPALSGWDVAGLVLVAMAGALALFRASVPWSAWSNWDTWAIWDFKVRAALEASGLPLAFLRDPDYGFTHPEYPFGWPAVQAFLAQCAGGFDTRFLRLVSPLHALCVPVLLAALLLEAGVSRGRWLVAGAVALLPAALAQSSNGYLDWPVAAATTASLVFLLRACRGAGPAWPAALFAGIAGNMKNEAGVFGLAVLLVLLLAAGGKRVRWRGFAAAAIVWVALVAPWRGLALANDLAPRDFAFVPAVAAAEAPGRIFMFLRATFLETIGPGLGGASFVSGDPVRWREWLDHLLNSWLLLWFAVAAVLVLRWRRIGKHGTRELAIVLGMQVAAAAVAYVLTIRDPRWLLASSLDRLLLQWVPAFTALASSLAAARETGGRG